MLIEPVKGGPVFVVEYFRDPNNTPRLQVCCIGYNLAEMVVVCAFALIFNHNFIFFLVLPYPQKNVSLIGPNRNLSSYYFQIAGA